MNCRSSQEVIWAIIPPFSSRSAFVLQIAPCLFPPRARYQGMPPDLLALFLLAGAPRAITLAAAMYIGLPRPETSFTLVVTLLLAYVLLSLAPLVLLPHRLFS